MVDVDALTRRFGNRITMHCEIANIFCQQDLLCKPLACDATTFHSHCTSNLVNAVTQLPLVPMLSSTVVQAPLANHYYYIIPADMANELAKLPTDI